MSSGSVRVATDKLQLEKLAIDRLRAAWNGFSARELPGPVVTLRAPRDEGKSVVFGLGTVEAGGLRIVAKELLAAAATVEVRIYKDVLPDLPLRGPQLLGAVDSVDSGRVWLFLEEIVGPRFDKTDGGHVGMASRWLATLHATSKQSEVGESLSWRGPDYYESLMTRTLSELEELPANPAIDREHVEVLRRLSCHLERLRSGRDAFADVYLGLPASVVHGDFKGNNMAFSETIAPSALRVFDWSEAHRGPWAVDLSWVDPSEYLAGLVSHGQRCDRADVDEWVVFGSIVRWTLAASWEIPGLRYEWVERRMRHMAMYENRLGTAIESSGWLR